MISTDETTVRRTTIEEVARLAGVSIATVSRTLHRPDVVSRKTRDAVFDAIEKTGYTQNSAAQNLRLQRSNAVLVIVPDIGNPFFSGILAGIEDVATANGYSILIGNAAGAIEREEALIAFLRNGRADGLLVLTGHLPEDFLQALQQAPLDRTPPVVMVAERLDGAEAIPHVLIDNKRAARHATKHLIELGHRRIAHVSGPPGNVLTADRIAGYQAALDAAGIPRDPALILPGDFSIRSGRTAAAALRALPTPPTAVFCANDEMAMGVVSDMVAEGVAVPEQLSVVGFDDIDFAACFIPALTTIHQPRERIGEEAMRLLLRLLRGGAHLDRQRIVLDAELVRRASTAAPPVGPDP